jgi:hypothetical protein
METPKLFCCGGAKGAYAHLRVFCESMEDLSIGYSFGGTPTDPLVKGRIVYFYDPKTTSLQEALLCRTDIMFQEFMGIFDAKEKAASAAAEAHEEESSAYFQLLQIMTGCVSKLVWILSQTPSLKYVHALARATRLQELIESVDSGSTSELRAYVDEHCIQPLVAIDAMYEKDRLTTLRTHEEDDGDDGDSGDKTA